MPTLERGPWTVDYLDEGEGEPVVLVHSSVSGNRQWKRLVERLRPRHRCLAPNLFGYGATTPWERAEKQSLAAGAELVLAVCEQAQRPVRLVGHSWGGALAVSAAAKLGPRVSHLALYEPMLTGLLQEHGTTEAQAEALRMYSIVIRLGDAKQWEALAEVFTDYFNGEGAWAATPPERRRIITSQLPPNRREWDCGADKLDPDVFAGITARTLVMRGGHTRRVTREVSEILCRLNPHWRMREFPEAGHMGPLTHAEQVNAAIEDFLGS